MAERKIGEIFKYNDEWYQCIEQPEEYDDTVCSLCAFHDNGNCKLDRCSGTYRSDKKSVIFKKLKKVRKPYYNSDNKLCQEYKCYIVPLITNEIVDAFADNRVIIEIKQNKENMEEYRMYDAKEDIPEFDKVVDECLFGEDKLNLKPFDLQEAKEGKPVCTRDGRKARIICFDRINGDYYKIVACVTAFDGNFEEVLFYGIDGYIVDSQNPKDEDLMMLPEKKEGWVNVYREETNNNERLIEQTIYKTRKDAFDNACPKGYITTTKINWEE